MQVKKYIAEKEAEYQREFRRLRMDYAPGARDFIGFLKEKGIPHGIATSAGEENIRFYAEEAGLYELFDPDTVVFNDGAMPGKPDPEIFFRAMRRLGRKPEACIIFEDSYFGIQAAERSGAGKIIIVNSEELDYSAYPHDVITNFDQVYRELF